MSPIIFTILLILSTIVGAILGKICAARQYRPRPPPDEVVSPPLSPMATDTALANLSRTAREVAEYHRLLGALGQGPPPTSPPPKRPKVDGNTLYFED